MTPNLQIDGIDIHVEGRGVEAIVMVHGWPDTHRLWDAQVQALAPHYRCVRFTLPGFDLALQRRAMSLAQMVEFIRRVVVAASPDRPVVMMVHDWGCLFGYQFAMRYPGLVSRIVGVDIGDAGSPQHARSLRPRDKAMVLGYQWWLAAAWRIGRGFGTGLGDRMTRFMARTMRCPAAPELIGAQMNYPYWIQWTGAYGGYRSALPFEPHCPMLYLYGRRKPFMFHSQAWIDALAAKPGSRVIAFETGHWVMSRKPQQFNDAVGAWLGAPSARAG